MRDCSKNTLRQATRGMQRFDWVAHSHNRSELSHPNGPRHSPLGRTYNERMPFSMLAFRNGLEMKCPVSRRSTFWIPDISFLAHCEKPALRRASARCTSSLEANDVGHSGATTRFCCGNVRPNRNAAYHVWPAVGCFSSSPS